MNAIGSYFFQVIMNRHCNLSGLSLQALKKKLFYYYYYLLVLDV